MAEHALKQDVERLMKRKLEIAAQVRQLQAEGARVNQELFQASPQDERVSRIIAAW
jgi:hypothetical protein